MAKRRDPQILAKKIKGIFSKSIQSDDSGAVLELVKKGSDIVSREDFLVFQDTFEKTFPLDGFWSFSTLIFALENRAYSVVESLLRIKADPNCRDTGYLPLVKAVSNEDVRSVELLLKYGAKPDLIMYQNGSKIDSILVATKKGNCAILKLLLVAMKESNTGDESQDEYYFTNAMRVAVSNNDCETAELLLSYGAEPNEFIERVGNPAYGKSLLTVARTYKSNKMAVLLEKFGANNKLLEEEDELSYLFELDFGTTTSPIATKEIQEEDSSQLVEAGAGVAFVGEASLLPSSSGECVVEEI